MLPRREVVKGALKILIGSTAVQMLGETSTPVAASAAKVSAHRAINIMNFIRAEEPRERADLMEPVREQMALIKAHRFPATWLLQYDALVEGPFVEFLKSEMPANHEVGIWFEMNRKICNDAGIAWRGNPNWEWDYHVPVAYPIGYTPDERKRLVDTAAATFKGVFGRDVKSVASWNLDAITVGHFSDKYAIDAFGNCRDQLATDGFTIWGCPIAGYYPSRLNAWSPAVDAVNQISSPIFRLLGQDPVYYYGEGIPAPDTMEPVWATGRSEIFVDRFLDMIANAPTQAFGYAKLGQENSFGWPSMLQAYPMQMEKLAKARSEGHLTVETMGDTGRRFKRTFKSTPRQAQVMLEDPLGRSNPPQRSVWYQSKYLRANLHFRGSQFYLRDLHVYNDKYPQPYLTEPVRQHGIEQRMLAVLDGYHWSDDEARSGRPGRRAMGRFALVDETGKDSPLTMLGLPAVTETGTELHTKVPLEGGGHLHATFREKDITLHLSGVPAESQFALIFEWVSERSALKQVKPNLLSYRFYDFDYSMRIISGKAKQTESGVMVIAEGTNTVRLHLAQGV